MIWILLIPASIAAAAWWLRGHRKLHKIKRWLFSNADIFKDIKSFEEITLTGNNLGDRHRDLNFKVNEALKKGVHIYDLCDTPNKSDVDGILKINLASQYRDVDFIIQVLKSGDSLYVTKALKCLWFYDDNYKYIINPNFLDKNIFPMMSLKMKKKTLTNISMNVREATRVASFYKYCIQENMLRLAQKFLIFTTESFKMNLMVNDWDKVNQDVKYLKMFIGSSFNLLKEYLNKLEHDEKLESLKTFRHFYTICPEKYLELTETYPYVLLLYPKRVGLRISIDIMKNYKHRVLEKPALYLDTLNVSVILKHLSSDEIKLCTIKLLPDSWEAFWSNKYYSKYEYLLNKCPVHERYKHLKEIYTNKYLDAEFEMLTEFYRNRCYNLMTADQKEEWALQHIESKKEILGHGQDYNWYAFINADKALPEIKKYILKTPDDHKRLYILEAMVRHARNDDDLSKILNYYYERHINEHRHNKESFVDIVIRHHDVFKLSDKCWRVLDSLFYSVEVYNYRSRSCRDEYRHIAIVRQLIHEGQLNDSLKQFLLFRPRAWLFQSFSLSNDQHQFIYNYMLNLYVEKAKEYENVKYTKEVKPDITKCVFRVIYLLQAYKKSLDDCPEIILKFLDYDQKPFMHFYIIKNKKDKNKQTTSLKLLNEDFTHFKTAINNNRKFNTKVLLRKLKTYYSNDIAKDYINNCLQVLSEKKPPKNQVFAAVTGIFQVADDSFKLKFMMEYVFEAPKIEHDKVDRTFLYIQEAICRFACLSRPPVPSSNMLMYIKGDYVKYCIPIYNYYAQNLPLPLFIEFTEGLLKCPISSKKHGLRLAFKCFNPKQLNYLIVRDWDELDVSLRVLVYKSLHDKIVNEREPDQSELFGVLVDILNRIHGNDDEEIFFLMTATTLPDHLMPKYVEVAWNAINKFPYKRVYHGVKARIVNNIKKYATKVNKDFIEDIIDSHVREILIDKKVRLKTDEMISLHKNKWSLTAEYILSSNEISKKNMDRINLILEKCVELWNYTYRDKFIFRVILIQFINELREKSVFVNMDEYVYLYDIFEKIMLYMQNNLDWSDICMIDCDMQLTVANRKAIHNAIVKHKDIDNVRIIDEIVYEFSELVGTIIEFDVNANSYYRSFSPQIKDKIIRNLQEFHNIRTARVSECDLSFNKVCENFVKGLIEFNIPEVYLIAVLILPIDSNNDEIFEVLYNYDNEEVQCLLYQKFLFRRR